MAIPVLLISGPVGVGKTTLGEEVSDLLKLKDIAHSLIDLDNLANTHPKPTDDPYGDRLALLSLRDIWARCAAAGSRNLIISRVVETDDLVSRIADAIPGARITVCQLTAGDRTLIERVRKRELGSDRSRHEKRALQLARSLAQTAPADFTIDTEQGSLSELAESIIARIVWEDGA